MKKVIKPSIPIEDLESYFYNELRAFVKADKVPQIMAILCDVTEDHFGDKNELKKVQELKAQYKQEIKDLSSIKDDDEF